MSLEVERLENYLWKDHKKYRGEGLHMKKSILVLIILLLFCSICYAQENNFRVNDNYFTSLEEAYNSITGAVGTIYVENNCTDESVLSIANDKKIYLNLNGKELTIKNAITNNGILFITGKEDEDNVLQSEPDNTSVKNLIVNNSELAIGNVSFHHYGNVPAAWSTI